MVIGCSCNQSCVHVSANQIPDYEQPWHYPVIRIQGCQYIVVESGSVWNGYGRSGHSLIHAADCDNPIHTKQGCK